MKISASIYSDKINTLATTIQNLNDNYVDMIHVDCKDNLAVFDDVATMKSNSKIPIDLHIITGNPEAYFDGIKKHQIDFVTFQYEDLTDKTLNIPNDFKGQLGLSITSNTPIEVFEQYKDRFDFILFMATIPGESGGSFDSRNFRRIRDFKKQFPNKRIHVDGGVNGEVSFILRNMGVYASVSGSYLFNSSTIGSALLNLKLNEIESHFLVKDFMLDLDESPYLFRDQLNLKNVINTMNQGKLGFTAVLEADNILNGIIGNADLRSGLLQHIEQLNGIEMNQIINSSPLVINENASVLDMIRFVKNSNKTILYLPVVNDNNELVGTLNFMNLIKGEI
ncbi:MAG: CBS domain-containing protein [Crocinitomicaceae bacterium]